MIMRGLLRLIRFDMPRPLWTGWSTHGSTDWTGWSRDSCRDCYTDVVSETALARMRPEKRAALIEAAAREFASRTFEEASLNRIISTCGMSKSSFYHVVDSKDDLFALVVADLAAAARRFWAPPAPETFSDGFWDRARSVWEDIARDMAEQPRAHASVAHRLCEFGQSRGPGARRPSRRMGARRAHRRA
jgi:AcrR family transcriptional regulator